jgi:hypothetical protein
MKLYLSVAHIGREERLRIAELAARIEEEFDAYIGTVAKSQLTPAGPQR